MTINICFIFGFILCVFSFNIFVNKFLIKILEKKDSKKEGMLHSFITDRIESYSDNRPKLEYLSMCLIHIAKYLIKNY